MSWFSPRSGFAWQSGYGAFTVSASQADRVCHYIERQQEHHRRRAFQEEFVAFLKAHGIEHDEQHLWDGWLRRVGLAVPLAPASV